MNAPYEWKDGKPLICAWHENKHKLEEMVMDKYPGIGISHGICQECLVKAMEEAKSHSIQREKLKRQHEPNR